MIHVETLPAAAEIATAVGGEVSALVSLVLGLGIKLLVDLGKKVSATFSAAPGPVKALVATAFGQAAAIISAKTGVFIDPNIEVFDVTFIGLALSAISMGIHSLTKTIVSSAKGNS
jgi:hypothetical protein